MLFGGSNPKKFGSRKNLGISWAIHVDPTMDLVHSVWAHFWDPTKNLWDPKSIDQKIWDSQIEIPKIGTLEEHSYKHSTCVRRGTKIPESSYVMASRDFATDVRTALMIFWLWQWRKRRHHRPQKVSPSSIATCFWTVVTSCNFCFVLYRPQLLELTDRAAQTKDRNFSVPTTAAMAKWALQTAWKVSYMADYILECAHELSDMLLSILCRVRLRGRIMKTLEFLFDFAFELLDNGRKWRRRHSLEVSFLWIPNDMVTDTTNWLVVCSVYCRRSKWIAQPSFSSFMFDKRSYRAIFSHMMGDYRIGFYSWLRKWIRLRLQSFL